jgi:hypothetical protein
LTVKHIIPLLSVCLSLGPLFIFGQSADDIKKNPAYLWGEGTGRTIDAASRNALDDLVSQISVTVESKFEQEFSEEITKSKGGNQSEFKETVRSVINTYSNVTLDNTQRLVLEQEPNARVLRYMPKADIDKIFANRKQRINEFIESAKKHEERAEVGRALRDYSKALNLLRSLPDSRLMAIRDGDKTVNTHSFITGKMDEILRDVRFDALAVRDKAQEREVELLVQFRGRRVQDLEFTYWDGKDWVASHQVKDGRGLIQFYGSTAAEYDQTNIKIEYVYDKQLFGDKELTEVFKVLEPVYFPNAQKELAFSREAKPAARPAEPEKKPAAKSEPEKQKHPLKKVDSEPFKAVVGEVTGAIRNKRETEVRKQFTDTGFEAYQKLLSYGKAKVVNDADFEVYQDGEEFISRGTYMAFDFEGGYKSFTEDVVFHFDRNRKIQNVAFGLGEEAVKTIYNNNAWSEPEKLLIVRFLEQYKTAFALKDLAYIESIFDDNALIIVGTMLKKHRPADGQMTKNPFDNEIVKYNRYSKQEYLEQLKTGFRSKEFINIEFEDSEFRKSNANPNFFGIQIKQNYHSSNYSDQGYLFLLIDFGDTTKPMIQVRTWQPEKNPDGSIYGLEHF